jgi:putative ABC transport system permease protein
MMLTDIFSETYAALSSNKARSGLTMLGIVIGISSVIVLVGVGQGATSSVTSKITDLGSNLLVISPGSTSSGGVRGGFGSASTLTEKDAQAIKSEVSGIASVAEVLTGRYQITYKSSNTNTQVIGTQSSYSDIRKISIDLGSFISDQQEKNTSKVAVLGPTTRDDLFGEGVDPTGKIIKINKIQFKIIGVAQAKGSSGSASNTDDAIYVPVTAAQTFLAGKSSISNINVQAQDSSTIDSAQQQITDLLLARHNISDATSADFTVTNQADIVSSLSAVTGTLTWLLGAIAGISLLVGGIGIMNMMLTTVTERTREIGLRKAVGAKRSDISSQFLAESIALTFAGGVIGILLGWAIAYIITKLGVVTAAVTWQSVLLSFGVSAVVGIIFGFYPSRKAASLKPIDALKYE